MLKVTKIGCLSYDLKLVYNKNKVEELKKWSDYFG